MTVEIRAVGADDAADWVAVLPQYAGRLVWEPAPAGWYGGTYPYAEDLTPDIRALSRLFLGGGSAQLLVTAGLIHEHRARIVDRLGRLIHTDPAPSNAFAF